MHYFLHFIGDKTGPKTLNDLPEVTWPAGSRTSVQGQTAQPSSYRQLSHPNLRLEYADDKQVKRNNKSILCRCGSKE